MSTEQLNLFFSVDIIIIICETDRARVGPEPGLGPELIL